MRTKTKTEFKEPAGAAALWFGVLAPPFAALCQLQANYALTLWACGGPGRTWALHVVTVAALLVASGGGWVACRKWRAAGSVWEDEGAGALPRGRFMAAVGMLASSLSALLMVAMWIPVFVYGPCQR